MYWGRKNSPPKCTPLINGLEICDRVKPGHKSVNLSNMSPSDVVNNNGFDKNFCVTVNNTDALGFLVANKINIPIQDAVKSRRLPPTVVCVNHKKANMYLDAMGIREQLGEVAEVLGECSVSDIRHVVKDASSMKLRFPDEGQEDIRRKVKVPAGCSEDLVAAAIRKALMDLDDSVPTGSSVKMVVGEGEMAAPPEITELHCGKINEGYEVLCGTRREMVLTDPFEDAAECTHEVRTDERFRLRRDLCAAES